jgi:hypothetical protein
MRNKNLAATSQPLAHNQYSVSWQSQHYLQCLPEKQETLLDKVCAGAAFLLCIAVLMFLG